MNVLLYSSQSVIFYWPIFFFDVLWGPWRSGAPVHWTAWTSWSVVLNPSESRGSYSATSNNLNLLHWPLMGGLLHLVQRGGSWAGWAPAQSPHRCTKCNSPPINSQCTNQSSLLYNGPLLRFWCVCKGLTGMTRRHVPPTFCMQQVLLPPPPNNNWLH